MLFFKCTSCRGLITNFEKRNYSEAFILLRQMVKSNELEFLAGSCPLDDWEVHLKNEDLYTMEHYFKCKCGKLFYVGMCVRGQPIVRIEKKLPNNLRKTISGHYGTYFDKSKSL